jgi:hypothetical protein
MVSGGSRVHVFKVWHHCITDSLIARAMSHVRIRVRALPDGVGDLRLVFPPNSQVVV